MKPMPAAIQRIRRVAQLISVITHSGNKILRLSVPIVSAVVTLIQEIRKRK